MRDTRLALNDFLVSVQKKALFQTELSLKNRDEAMDIVQESMVKLAEKYADKPDDWPKLFQRILQNAIYDWHRRSKVRRIIVWWNQTADESETVEDFIGKNLGENLNDASHHAVVGEIEPAKYFENHQLREAILKALAVLPLRQQQAFLLRAWWGSDVEETAYAMSCSAGSVKTHYSRALQKLKQQLVELGNA